MPALTEDDLIDLAGGATVLLAKQLVLKGKVKKAIWAFPNVEALVDDGTESREARWNLRSITFQRNECACEVSIRQRKLCVHSAAAYLALAAKEGTIKLTEDAPPKPAAASKTDVKENSKSAKTEPTAALRGPSSNPSTSPRNAARRSRFASSFRRISPRRRSATKSSAAWSSASTVSKPPRKISTAPRLGPSSPTRSSSWPSSRTSVTASYRACYHSPAGTCDSSSAWAKDWPSSGWPMRPRFPWPGPEIA